MTERDEFKELDKSLRREKIIDTAIEIFHRLGYRAATLDNVASELGLTRSALYHYFRSKEQLLSSIYLKALDRFFARAYEISESELSTHEKLCSFIRHHLKHIHENLSLYGVFFSEEAELSDEDARRIREAKRVYTKAIEQVLKQGMLEGVYRRASPQLLVAAILGMVNWTYKWYKPGRIGQGCEEITDEFIAFMEKGILADDGCEGGRDKQKRKEAMRLIFGELKEGSEKLNRLISELKAILHC